MMCVVSVVSNKEGERGQSAPLPSITSSHPLWSIPPGSLLHLLPGPAEVLEDDR